MKERMASKPKIHVVGMGGTIAGVGATATNSAYESGQIDTSDLIAMVEGLDQLADVKSETLFTSGSENLGPKQWQKLACRIEELGESPEVDGVVVTHGTDTLEEAAFFLDLVCKPKKPVVLTAAMRPSTALSADGPANMLQATLTVTSPELRSPGILVTMNGLVIQGWQAIKTHSLSLESFCAYPGGPAGRILGKNLILFGAPGPSPIAGRFHDHLLKDKELPPVEIIFLRGGCGVRPLASLNKNELKGLVISGFGAGTVPEDLAASLPEKMNPKCLVVVSSRVPQVMVIPETMTPIKGGNAVPSGMLNPQKSAILLSLALDEGLTVQEIARLFKMFS